MRPNSDAAWGMMSPNPLCCWSVIPRLICEKEVCELVCCRPWSFAAFRRETVHSQFDVNGLLSTIGGPRPAVALCYALGGTSSALGRPCLSIGHPGRDDIERERGRLLRSKLSKLISLVSFFYSANFSALIPNLTNVVIEKVKSCDRACAIGRERVTSTNEWTRKCAIRWAACMRIGRLFTPHVCNFMLRPRSI